MMIRGYRSTRGTAGADSEALQTDVMRFIAIIGLCLAAIFSLMRGISAPVESRESPSENTALAQQMENLQSRSSGQQQAIELLQEQLNSSEEQLIINQQQLARTSQQEQKLTQVNARVSGLSKSLSISKSDQLLLEKKLLQAKVSNSKLQQQLKVLKQAPAKPEPMKVTVIQKLPPVPVKRVKPIKPIKPIKPAETLKPLKPIQLAKPVDPVKPITAIPDTPPAAVAKPQRQGFALKFASDRSLDSLIRNNSVKLLAVSKPAAWRLSLAKSQPVFEKISMPKQYHEMLLDTVPYSYQQALKHTRMSAKTSRITWAVQLSSDMQRKIQSLVRSAKGGDLIIHKDASITLKTGTAE